VLLPYLDEKGVGVINASPLGMGLLGDPAALPDWHPAPPELRTACARAKAVCEEAGVDLADLALAFSVARPDIHTTLVGSASALQMERNIRALDHAPAPELLAQIRRALQTVRDLSWPSGRPENEIW
jgi:aryl-alcohol dehydrogenase-like predicted oxidoreductase